MFCKLINNNYEDLFVDMVVLTTNNSASDFINCVSSNTYSFKRGFRTTDVYTFNISNFLVGLIKDLDFEVIL